MHTMQVQNISLIYIIDRYQKMNMAQQSEPAKTINLQQQIVRCYKCLSGLLTNDTASIRQSQSQLLLMSKSGQFIKVILSIPYISGISIDVCKLAISYVKTYVKNLLNQNKYIVAINVSANIIQCLRFSHLDFQLKKQLATSLICLLNNEKTRAQIASYEQQLTNLLTQSLLLYNNTLDINNQNNTQNINNKNTKNQINFQYICLLTQIVLDCMPSPIVNHSQFLQRTFPNIIRISIILTQLLNKSIQNSQTNIAHPLQLISILLQCITKYIKNIQQINNYGYSNRIYQVIDGCGIVELITKCLNINLLNNTQNIPIFYFALQSHKNMYSTKSVQNFHLLKTNIITIIRHCTKIYLYNLTKYQQSLLYKYSIQLITNFIKSVSHILQHRNYYNLEDKMQIQIIQQIYIYMGYALKTNKYYKLFLEAKSLLIYGCVLKTLVFSQQDYYNFSQNPQQFVNALYQIFEMNKNKSKDKNKQKQKNKQTLQQIYKFGNSKKQKQIMKQQQPNKQQKQQHQNISQQPSAFPQKQQQQQQITQLFDNLKTNSSKLLINYVQHIDGALLQLVIFGLSIIGSTNQQSVYKRDMLLFMLSIVRDQVTDGALKYNIGRMLAFVLSNRQLPLKNKKQDIDKPTILNVQYSMILLALDRYILLIEQYAQHLFQSIFTVIEQIIIQPMMQQVSKIISTQLIITMLATPQGSYSTDKMAQLMCSTLQPQKLHRKSLHCLQIIFKQYGLQFKHDLPPVIKIVNKLISLIQLQIQDSQTNLDLLNIQWNILKEISSNQFIMPQIKTYLQAPFNLLIKSIDGNNQLILQQHIYQIIVNFIRKTNKITAFQLQFITVAKTIFYNANCKYSLKTIFQLLQNIIYYGNVTLSHNIGYIKDIIQMCVYSINQITVNQMPRSQSQYCQGVLIMQSLIVSVGKYFDKQMWDVCLKCVYNKYKYTSITYDFLKASLVTNIALILVFAYNYFNVQQINQIVNVVLKEYHCFTYKDSSKLFITSIIQLLPLVQVPFVQNYYHQILDCAVTVLKIIRMGKDKIFDRQDLNCQQIQYYKLKSHTINSIDKLDQFQLFHQEVVKAKNKNIQLFQRAYVSLAENKKIFMKQLLSVRKINNQMRTIYKLKPKS